MTSDFIYEEGLHLRGTPLWFDATEPRQFCFVSSGKQRRLPRHGRLLASPPTARFSRVRVGRAEVLVTPYNRPFTLGNLRLELMPSGTMLGASQLVVERDGVRYVYTGQIGPLDGISTALAPQVRRCDVLLLAAPDEVVATKAERAAGWQKLAEVVADVRAQGGLPVVLVEPLGLAQEVIAWSLLQGLSARAHRSICEFTQDYRRLSASSAAALVVPSRLREYDRKPQADIIMMPRLLWRSPLVSRLASVRFIIPTGRAGRVAGDPPGAIYLPAVTTEATLEELHAFASNTQAGEVVVTGRQVEPVATYLADAGLTVSRLRVPGQRSLFTWVPPHLST